MKALRGQRGHRVGMLAWATIIVVALLVGGYVLASAPGAIQDQRAEATRVNCEEQNARHDDAVRALDTLISRVPPKQRQRAEMGRANTLLLINALAPHRDCKALVRRTVSQPPGRN